MAKPVSIYERNIARAWDKLVIYGPLAGEHSLQVVGKAGHVIALRVPVSTFAASLDQPTWTYDVDTRRLIVKSWREWRGDGDGEFKLIQVKREKFDIVRGVFEHARRFWDYVPSLAIEAVIGESRTASPRLYDQNAMTELLALVEAGSKSVAR